MRVPVHTILTIIVLSVFSMTLARADVPSRISVGGQLTDSAGVPVAAGTVSLVFKIFDAEVSGTEIWPAGPAPCDVCAPIPSVWSCP